MRKAFLPQSASDRGNNQTSICGFRRISPSPKIKFGFTCQPRNSNTEASRSLSSFAQSPNGEAWQVVLLGITDRRERRPPTKPLMKRQLICSPLNPPKRFTNILNHVNLADPIMRIADPGFGHFDPLRLESQPPPTT